VIAQQDAWAHRETGWSSDLVAQTESLLALSNGYLGMRGTLDEGAPAAIPGTYLNGFYDTLPIPYADRGFSDPESDQVLVNITDGTRIRLIVGEDPLDVRTGTVLAQERVLDLRSGLLTRSLRWRSPSGQEITLRSRRLVSLEYREVAAIEYEVEVARTTRLTVHSELATGTGGSTDAAADPRSGRGLSPDVLIPRLAHHEGARALLVHETRTSGLVVAAGMDHVLDGTPSPEATIREDGSLARWSYSTTVHPGRPLRLVKLLAYHWAAGGEPAALAADGCRSLEHARALGFEALAAGQRKLLDEVWTRADIEIDGDPELQHALRYALFQLHQNTALAAGHAIPAKGLTGGGYDGHTFWDTEIFLLPVLTYCAPQHVEAALRWRASTLPQARANARRLGLSGAAFPWRTIAGEECSGYLPAGTAAFHINADIAHAVTQYVAATGDTRFEREAGAPLLVETARLWASLGYHDARRGGRFSIDGVTGPDEYSVLVDNNLYTNLMAQANLRAAADAVERHGPQALGVQAREVVAWRRAADAMTIPYDTELGVHLQDEDFARHAPLDFDTISPEHYPLLLHVPYFQLYRHQVIKQPDLVLAMALCPRAFTAEQRQCNFAHYEALTVRDSSLAAGTQAVVAAQVGDVQLAYDYLAEAALLDHHDSERNTADGLHLAALASGWTAVIAGLAGARQQDGRLSFAPRLPGPLDRIAFPFTFRGRVLRIEITPGEATYELRDGPPLQIEHWGTPLLLTSATGVTRTIPPAPGVMSFRQPAGRAPRRRRPAHRRGPGAPPGP
jgi:alpha,alpha-trehalose phosphorylase